MKHLLFILTAFLFITSCNKEDRFASLSEDDTSLASQQPDYVEEIKSLVIEDVKPKISGKKRKTVDVVDTVGKKDLKKEEKLVTHIEVTSDIVVKVDQKTLAKAEKHVKEELDNTDRTVNLKQEQTTVVETTVTTEEAVDLGPKLNILVYIDKKAYGTCVNRFKRNHKSFFSALSEYNWSISFASYTDAVGADLAPLKYNDSTYDASEKIFRWKIKKDYTLSKAEYSDKKASHLFYSTLNPVDEHKHTSPNIKHTKLVANPLGGLSQVLSSNSDKESRTVVLFFGNQFPYYSKSEWDNFYSKHPNVGLVALSYRSANVSNFIHVLDKEEYDFSFVSGCGKSGQAIVDAAHLK